MSLAEEFRERLQDPDEEVRHGAVMELAESGRSALPLLGVGLGDSSWRVRKAALEAVVALPGEETIAILLKGIRDEESAGRRNTCMEALIRLGDASIAHLPSLLGDPDPDVRKFGVDILGNIESVGALAPLLDALEDSEDNVAAAAAEYLGRKKHAAAVPALVSRMERGDFWVKFSCLRALGEIGDPSAGEAVLKMAGERELKKVSLEALGSMNVPAASPLILESLFSQDRGLRTTAVLAASGLLRRTEADPGETEGLRRGIRENVTEDFSDYLQGLLLQEKAGLRAAAIVVLAAAVGEKAVDPLMEILPDVSEEEGRVISEALETLPEKSLPVLFGHLRSPQPAVRQSAAAVLGKRTCRAAVPHLVGLLEDENGHVRSRAAEALGRIGEGIAVAPLVSLLGDPYPDVRQAGVEALGRLGKSGEEMRTLVLNFLDPHLDSQDQDLVANALRIVAALGSRDVMDRLSFALKDERSQIRRAAVEALGSIDSPEAAETLRVAFIDEDPAVRREAVQKMGAMNVQGTFPYLQPMLQDEDLWVKVRAVQAIAGQRDDEAEAILMKTVQGEPPGPVRLAAIRAVGQRTTDAGLELLLSLAAEGDRESRMAAIESLGTMAREEAIDTLVRSLGDEDWGLRSMAVKSLGPFTGKPAVRAALENTAAADADQMVRKAAASALEA